MALPAELGEGMAAHLTNGLLAEQPYRASARFRCDDEERLIDIYLAQVARGREGIKDLTELMRIARSATACSITALPARESPDGEATRPRRPWCRGRGRASATVPQWAARLMAEMMALSEAVVVLASTPTPHSTLPSTSHSR